MHRPRRGRGIGALALSAIFHTALIVAVVLHSPVLRFPIEERGPPEPIIPVLLMPKTPPAPQGPPAPIRLHRRPQHFALPPPIPPLPIPPVEEPPRPTRPTGPATIHPAPLPETPKSDLRATLRASPVGCADPDAVGLTKAEREFCYAQLGKGAKSGSFLGLGLSRDKQTILDRVGAAKEARRKEIEAPPPSGPDPNGASRPAWDRPRDPLDAPR